MSDADIKTYLIRGVSEFVTNFIKEIMRMVLVEKNISQ